MDLKFGLVALHPARHHYGAQDNQRSGVGPDQVLHLQDASGFGLMWLLENDLHHESHFAALRLDHWDIVPGRLEDHDISALGWGRDLVQGHALENAEEECFVVAHWEACGVAHRNDLSAELIPKLEYALGRDDL